MQTLSNITNLTAKRMLIVGMARSGIAAAELAAVFGIKPVLNDLRSEESFEGKLEHLKAMGAELRLGMKAEDALFDCDALMISPGVPINAPVIKKAEEMQIPVLGELEFAARFIRSDMVALTGTNGKTTTTSLVAHIFETADKKTVAAGNIGYPLSNAVREVGEGGMIVCEVSSFQLETTDMFHPAAAAVLNITEDHLNRHGTMENYIALKRHIFDAQTADDFVILNYDDEATRKMAENQKGKVLFFSRLQEVAEGAYVKDGVITLRMDGKETALVAADDLPIPGPHNLENALAAALLCHVRGVHRDDLCKGLLTFQGVEHRIEFVCEKQGVRYINDSKGTNVDSTVKAVLSMKKPTALILGGSEKDADFTPLAQVIMENPVIAHCIVMGETGPKIEKALRDAGYHAIHKSASMEESVHIAAQLMKDGGNVLLSPACASFDMFKDYEERGRVFKQLVNEL